MDYSTPSLPLHHQLPELIQTQVHSVMRPSNNLILCCPLLLLPSISPSIRVFSNDLALHIRWPKYCGYHWQNEPGTHKASEWCQTCSVRCMIKVIGGTVYPDVSTSFIFIFFFWLSHIAGRISVPQPGIEPMPSGVEVANFFFLI